MTNTIKRPHIIVVGNEKGGVGKTTTAVHLMINLLYDGYKVSSIDIDSRQRSISHFLENRRNYILSQKINLPFPSHFIINRSRLDSAEESKKDERSRFLECIKRAGEEGDFIIIDAPGADSYMSRIAHSYADTIITPINDSFIDLNVLARVDDESLKVERHGIYSEMVWEAKVNRAKRSNTEIDWVILRNRLTNIDARNKRRMAVALHNFSKRVGCRLAKGFGERVIYRELFLKGLSLLDIMAEGSEFNVKMSHITARQELREMMEFLEIEKKVPLSESLSNTKAAPAVDEKKATSAA